MITFSDDAYKLDQEQSHISAYLELSNPYIGWYVEVHARETPESVDDNEENYNQPLFARLNFHTESEKSWKQLSDEGVSVEFECNKQINMMPSDPACLWVGYGYLPLRHRIRLAIKRAKHFAIDWECEAFDQILWECDLDGSFMFRCNDKLPFKGVTVSLSDAERVFDKSKPFGNLINRKHEEAPLIERANKAMSPFFEVAEFAEPTEVAGGLHYHLKSFHQGMF